MQKFFQHWFAESVKRKEVSLSEFQRISSACKIFARSLDFELECKEGVFGFSNSGILNKRSHCEVVWGRLPLTWQELAVFMVWCLHQRAKTENSNFYRACVKRHAQLQGLPIDDTMLEELFKRVN